MLVRKNIYIENNLWQTLEFLKNQKKKSISKIINDALNTFLQKEAGGNIGLILKLNSEYATDDESLELNEILNNLSKDDLEIGEITKL